jgi:integrase
MLTDAEARKAAKADKDYKMYDSGGLFLVVAKSGAKLWRMKYELGGKEKLLSFGPYPDVTITAARDARDAARLELRAGRDPSLTRKVMRANAIATDRGFEVIARDWHKLQTPQWSERHAADVLGTLERLVFPKLGTIDVREITTPMVLDVIRRIEARPAVETAARVRQRMSAVFVHAISSGLATQDPAAVVQGALAPLIRGRQPALVELDQARKVLTDVDAERARPVTKLAIRLLALTAIRPGTLTGALWSEFSGLNGQEPLWDIPADRMKGTVELKRPHLVPLSRQAAEVIEAIRPLTGRSKFVFPNGRSVHRPMSENAMGYLLNRAGYHNRHVPHGWRATFSTIMNEKYPADTKIIEVVLAHVDENKVAGAYNRAIYLDRRRELGQIWADMLLKDMPPAAALLEGPRR